MTKSVRQILAPAITLVLCVSVYPNSAEDIIVNTANGPVRGEKRPVENDQGGYYAFHAIPYAAPPVDELRFKPPQPIKSNWTTTYNASSSTDKNAKKCLRTKVT